MLDYFFNNMNPLNFGIKNYSELRIVNDYYNRVLNTLSTYADKREYIINNKHVLIRLIKECFVDFNMDDLIFYKHVEERTNYVHKLLGFSSRYNKGEWIYNDSYEGAAEHYYHSDEMIKIYDIKSIWHLLDAIEIIYTDNEIFDFPFINTIKKNNTFIYKINSSLFLLQYKLWGEERLKKDLLVNPGTFINSFIYPKILKSYLDHTCINYLDKLLDNEKEIFEFKNTTPLGISNYNKDITKAYLSFINDYRNKKIHVDKILLNMPMIFSANGYELLNLKDVDIRRQNVWLKYFTRIKHCNMLMKIFEYQGLLTNTNLISSLKNDFKEYKNLSLTLPDKTKKETLDWFNNQIEKLYL